MKRFFTSAALACAMLAAGPSRGEEPTPPESRPEITLRIDAEGRLLRPAEAVSGSGPKEAPQSWAGMTWKDLGFLIEHSQSRKPAAASRPDAPLAAAPSRRIRVVLRWEADKRRCRIAQEGSTVQYDGKGIATVRSSLQKAAVGERLEVRLDAGPDVPCRWILAAVQMVRDSKKWGLLVRIPSTCQESEELAEALRALPLRAGQLRLGEGVLHVLVDNEAPFEALAAIPLLAARSAFATIRIGNRPAAMMDLVRPEERHADGSTPAEAENRDAAILKALDWLREHQEPGGWWSSRKFMLRCGKGPCTGPGAHDDYSVALTALALRSFLGAGHTRGQGEYRETVSKAIQALIAFQTPDGCLGAKTADGHWIYNLAMGTHAMCEALAWERGDATLEAACRKAAGFLVECQNPGSGWRYGKQPTDNDTSCTVVAVAALKAASIAGLEVPEPVFSGALNWLDGVTDPELGATGYTTAGDTGALLQEAVGKYLPQPSMTAAAIFCRLGIQGKTALSEDSVVNGSKLLLLALPAWDGAKGNTSMYYWYWGTAASVMLGEGHREKWEPRLLRALVPNQVDSGCGRGSWDPVDAWGTAGGRVYATAMSALALECLLRYRRDLVVK